MSESQQTDKYISEINKFIELENEPLERAKLMMHLSIIQENRANIEAFKSITSRHNRRITDSEDTLDKHSKLLTQFQAVIMFVVFISGGVGTVLYQAADTVYNQVDKLRIQQTALETKVDYLVESQKKGKR